MGKSDAVAACWVIPQSDSELTEADEHAFEVLNRLKKAFPNAMCTLDFKTPVQLLFVTILFAQCTVERVNKVTAGLFRNYPTAQGLATAAIERLGKNHSFHRLLSSKSQEHSGKL